MTLAGFIFLSHEEKKEILLHNGILIAKRMNSDCMVFLFQLDLIYVEIFCNKGTKEVMEYRAFEGTNQLHPYLEEISIDNLLK